MASTPYLDLLESLRTHCSLPEFPDPLPSTQLDLELENGPTVTIDFNEETQFVELFSELGIYPPERELEILKKIAEANFLWSSTNGSTLSIRPEIQTAYLAVQLPVLSLNGTDFVLLVEKFVETTKHWQAILSGSATEEPPPTEDNQQPLEEHSKHLSPQDNFIKA
ncbi:MAG: type III secretion system chaperone [Verrucomicrobiae bacterium]|nr:type III secretion system chaperone [Verrucomicrobiae bacterium]